MVSPTPFGTPFLVNTTIFSEQHSPSITTLSDGRFVVSWADGSQSGGNTSYTAVRAQVFHTNGEPTGDEFLVNTTTIKTQSNPTVIALDGGKFLVSWVDSSSSTVDDPNQNIRAQMFNADATPLGSEFLVNTKTQHYQTSVIGTALSDGKFVLVWGDENGDPTTRSVDDIRAQMYNADGTPLGSEFLVNTITMDSQVRPDITALSNGGFVVTWTDSRRAVPIDPDIQGNLIRFQAFNASGTPVGGEVIVAETTYGQQTASTITDIGGGKFVITWEAAEPQSSDTTKNIFARVFSNDGTAISDPISVTDASGLSQRDPVITGLDDGRFVIAWQGRWLLDNGYRQGGVQAKVFNSDGSLSSDTFIESGERGHPALTTLKDGRIVITWDDNNRTLGDDSGRSVQAQIYDLRTAAIKFSGNASAEEYAGTSFADKLAGHRGNDVLYGMGANDRLIGGLGHDSLFGGDGNDLLAGGRGRDYLQGDAGNDRLFGHQLADTLYGGDGTDTLNGGFGFDTLYGGSGGDKLVGARGNDLMFGGDDNDRMFGGKGNDHLYGGAGKDLMKGQLGADVFHFEAANETGTTISTRDVILDFATGLDKIDISQIDAATAAGDQAFVFIGNQAFSQTEGELRYKTTNVRTVIQADMDGDGIADFEIGLRGIVTLSSDDFIL